VQKDIPKASSALTQLVAMDRTYTDFELMNKWNVKGIFFVIRMKNNAVCKVVSHREVPKNRNILSRENRKGSSSFDQPS
jgi:hypothetical protein